MSQIENHKSKIKNLKSKIILGVLLLLALVLLGPFLVPVPPLTDTRPPKELADLDSRFVTVEGLEVHYKVTGEGTPPLILLHGFGASLFSWREIMSPLGEQTTVLAFDRPAFGLTERPLRAEWGNRNPYASDFQVDLTVAMIDLLGAERAVLVGNSAGGTIAMLTALEYPERVKALILVDPAVYAQGGVPAWTRPLLNTPQMRHLGPLISRRIRTWGLDFARSAWHDPGKITAEVWEGYQKPLQAENWDVALWELTLAGRPSRLAERLSELTLPVLVITGDDDRIVPTEQSVRLAGELPNAELVVIPNCGHVPHEECPQPVLQAITSFLARIR